MKSAPFREEDQCHTGVSNLTACRTVCQSHNTLGCHVPVGLFTNLGLPETRRTRRTLKIHGMGERDGQEKNPGKKI